ncbi:methanogenesis marker protein 11 [[Eubacterium] cellulosolvens]
MLQRDEILENIRQKPWVSPFEKIIGVYSETENLVQIYEYHARNVCYGAAAWAVFHYKRSSTLVMDARRDGVRDIFTLKPGECELNLKPSYASAGIEAVKISEDKIHVTYAGLAGGGVGSTLCRALARGVDGAVIHNEGGGDKLGRATLVIPLKLKLQVGVDDTDKPGAGATWSLANEIAVELSKSKGIDYLNHTLVQLYPGTPEKTTNCVATVMTFAVEKDRMGHLKNELQQGFSRATLSKHTGLAFWSGISIPNKLRQFANRARAEVVTIEQTKNMANELDIELQTVTGVRGCIGATAALGYAERQDEAVKLDYS